MRFHRPARRIALGLGAAGLVLGASGATAAATDLIQPAGALSVQVPAVAVREQNVNSAGRIRVALPKGGVGVNGSVAVSNLPVNSAGRLRTAPSSGGTSYGARSGPWFQVSASSPVTLTDVQGRGVFHGVVMVVGTGLGNGSGFNCGQPGGFVTVTIDGHVAFDGDGCWGADGYYGASSALGGSNNGSSGELHFFPPGGMAFQKSLVVTVSGDSGVAAQVWAQAYYTTNS